MEGGENHPEEKERGIKEDNEEDRETRGEGWRGEGSGGIYTQGPFPLGEELVGFGNRERLREPPDIVI